MRLIDADALIEYCDKKWIPLNVNAVNAQPTIEPERKTGQWLQISPAGIYECSECGQTVMTKDISCYKFCHGCGAYMGGDESV